MLQNGSCCIQQPRVCSLKRSYLWHLINPGLNEITAKAIEKDKATGDSEIWIPQSVVLSVRGKGVFLKFQHADFSQLANVCSHLKIAILVNASSNLKIHCLHLIYWHRLATWRPLACQTANGRMCVSYFTSGPGAGVNILGFVQQLQRPIFPSGPQTQLRLLYQPVRFVFVHDNAAVLFSLIQSLSIEERPSAMCDNIIWQSQAL